MRMTMRKTRTIFTRMEKDHLVTFWSPSSGVLSIERLLVATCNYVVSSLSSLSGPSRTEYVEMACVFVVHYCCKF